MFILSSFIFALNSTLPVFLVILVGRFFMRVGIINEEWTKISDRMAFRYALPVVLFLDIAKMDIHRDLDMTFIIFCMVSTTAMFFFNLPDKQDLPKRQDHGRVICPGCCQG